MIGPGSDKNEQIVTLRYWNLNVIVHGSFLFHLKNDKKFKTGGQFSTWVPTSSLSSAILMHGWLFEEAWNVRLSNSSNICCHMLGWCNKVLYKWRFGMVRAPPASHRPQWGCPPQSHFLLTLASYPGWPWLKYVQAVQNSSFKSEWTYVSPLVNLAHLHYLLLQPIAIWQILPEQSCFLNISYFDNSQQTCSPLLFC